jgi:hypothetical protein
MRIKTLLSAASLIALTSTASADPPSRVARISFIGGMVSYRPATEDEWAVASLNIPLTIDDHLWTDANARAELDAGDVTVRVAPLTDVSVTNLDDRIVQLRLGQGTLSVRARQPESDEVIEIDTPNGAITVREGLYRFDVAESGQTTTVTVREGEANVATGSAQQQLHASEAIVLGNDVSPVPPARRDDFEDWVLTRDRRFDTAPSLQYVSPGTIGYADLDQYGSWRPATGYGPVWVPRVQAEWVPYRFGHWAWIEPWGWTWIDDAPWGFAPFHYGRWVYVSGVGWAWMPGQRLVRPVYAPALVAFVGGNGWRVSASFGAEPVAWFPLGPREVYVPGYRVSPVYVAAINRPQVNVTNVTVNVTNVTYVNRTVPNAVTAVPREAFVRAQPIAKVAVAVPPASLQAAAVLGTAPSVQPQGRVSVVGQARPAPAPPAAAVQRQVVTRTPRVAAPVPPAPAQQTAPGAKPAPPSPAPGPANRPQTQPSTQDLQAQQAAERAALVSRQAAERAQLQAQHQQQLHAAHSADERKQLVAQHQQDQKAMQDRHRQEREAMQQKQQEERAAAKRSGG